MRFRSEVKLVVWRLKLRLCGPEPCVLVQFWLIFWIWFRFWFWFWLWSTGLGRVSPSQMTVAREDGTNSQDDATDEIMDRLVKSVTQNPSDRPSSPKTRKRSRLNRKSREYTGGCWDAYLVFNTQSWSSVSEFMFDSENKRKQRKIAAADQEPVRSSLGFLGLFWGRDLRASAGSVWFRLCVKTQQQLCVQNSSISVQLHISVFTSSVNPLQIIIRSNRPAAVRTLWSTESNWRETKTLYL